MRQADYAQAAERPETCRNFPIRQRWSVMRPYLSKGADVKMFVRSASRRRAYQYCLALNPSSGIRMRMDGDQEAEEKGCR